LIFKQQFGLEHITGTAGENWRFSRCLFC